MNRSLLRASMIASLGCLATPALAATCTFSTAGAGGVTDAPCRSIDLQVDVSTTGSGLSTVDYAVTLVRTIDERSAQLERMLFVSTLGTTTITYTPDAGATVLLTLLNPSLVSRSAIDEGRSFNATETLQIVAGAYTWTVIP